MSTNASKFVFLVIFDTCDVVYNWSISLLLPIVLDNLFDIDGHFLHFSLVILHLTHHFQVT